MKKKILALLLILGMSFVLMACGDDGSTETTEESTEKETVTEENVAENTDETKEDTNPETENPETDNEETSDDISIGDSFETGPYTVIINSVRKATDYEDNPAIVINYNWTNNSEETTSWLGSMYTQVFQDGVSLETAIMMEGKDSETSMKDVRPGTTVEGVEEAFVTTSESELEIEIQAMEDMFTGGPVLVITDYPAE